MSCCVFCVVLVLLSLMLCLLLLFAACALQAWHPSDSSALILLGPWRGAFSPADWADLLQRSITPKLAAALAGLTINPLAQVRKLRGHVVACYLEVIV
jgi:hypothetical protein